MMRPESKMVMKMMLMKMLLNDYEHHQIYDDSNKLFGNNIGQYLQRNMEESDGFIASITPYAAHAKQT
jgi:hypothetical protein